MSYRFLLGFCFLTVLSEQLLGAPVTTLTTLEPTTAEPAVPTTEDSASTTTTDINDDEDVATRYLRRYGYAKPGFTKNSYGFEDELRHSIKRMQRFYNLNETGDLDNDTLTVITSPRCSFPDLITGADGRSKRYVAYSKWSRRDLTYFTNNYPATTTGFNSVADIDALFDNAYKKWTEVSDLTITKSPTSNANLRSTFYRRDHGDGDPFDGPGGILAHAFFPQVGQTHFDNDERWSATNNGFNLFVVAIHEYGHALGLGHTNDRNAIMYPTYQYSTNPRLGTDDILGIQSLYGPSKNSGITPVPTTPKPTTTTRRSSWGSFWDWFWRG